MAERFRKKPVEVEAVMFTGTNFREVVTFFDSGGNVDAEIKPDSIVARSKIVIKTLEGPITASAGDWIIRGVHGEFYPCKPDIFEKTYDRVGTGVAR